MRPLPTYRSPKEVAASLSISERQVRDLCQKAARGEPGGITATKIGSHWRIKDSDLQAFINGSSGRGK